MAGMEIIDRPNGVARLFFDKCRKFNVDSRFKCRVVREIVFGSFRSVGGPGAGCHPPEIKRFLDICPFSVVTY